MSKFDWEKVLIQHRVQYSTRGKNVSRGNLVVHCPFCGHDDPSQHMSVSVDGTGWRCLRQPDAHRGKKPTRLLAALLNISIGQVASIVGDTTYLPTDFMGALDEALNGKRKVFDDRKLDMPKEFEPIPKLGARRRFRPFENYLLERGFPETTIDKLTLRYNLRYCTAGAYEDRIIFPITDNGKLLTWSARAIFPSMGLRYKVLSSDPEKARSEGYEPAVGPITNYLLFYDHIVDCDASVLYICEGPFDALKLCVLGRKIGAVATCFFTAAPSEEQVAQLFELFPQFEHVVLLLDRGTMATQMRTISRFSGFTLERGKLPPEFKDPGELNHRAFERIHRSITT